jgi:hypothetical protein
VIITHFTGVMSEPVFFCIGFLGLLLVLIYIRSRQPIWLWASAILAGLTFITRFSGAALIGAGCVAIVMFPPNPIKKRLLDALLYFGMGMVPFILYRVYLKRIGAYLGVYGVPALPEMAKLVNGFFTTLASEGVGWLPWGTLIGPRFPHQKGLILIALGLIAVSILAAVLIRRGKAAFRAAWDRPNFQLGVTFLVFNLGYVALLIGTYLFVSFPKPYIDGRLLSPLLVGGLLCAAGFLDYILEEIRPVSLRQIIPAALLMIFIVANLSITASYVQAMHIAGDGYTAKKWQRSGTVKALVKLPASVHIISDNIDVVKLYTFRAASRIPELESQTPRPLDQAFGGDPSDPVEAQFRGGQAALVLFNDAYTQFSAMYGERAAQVRWKALTAGLYAYYQGADGAIYFYSAPK